MNRTGAVFVFLLLSAGFLSPPASAQYRTKIEQAEALLKKGKKKQALEILEFVFEKSKETDEIRQIGNLILAAAPLNYPKRENFLKYLVKFVPDHPDSRKWLMELGDRARRKNDLDEAEDWYLRAEAIEGDSLPIDQKFFSLYQEKKLYHRAFERGLHIIETHPELGTASFRRDLARLWWKTGPLSEELFARLINHRDGMIIIHELIMQAPKKGDIKAGVFSQLRANEKTQKLVPSEETEKEKPVSAPAMKTASAPEVPGPFVEKKDSPPPPVEAPKLQTPPPPPAAVAPPPPPAPAPAIPAPEVKPMPVPAAPPAPVLQPAPAKPSPPPPPPPPAVRKMDTKSDYLNYAQELATQRNINLKELNETVSKIYQKFSLDAEETAVKNSMTTLEKWKSQSFPSKFNSEFLIQLRVCQDDIDRSLTTLQKSPDIWKKITAPFVSNLMNNIAQKMLVALDQSEIKSGPNEGDQKEQKLLLIREIEKKYSHFVER